MGSCLTQSVFAQRSLPWHEICDKLRLTNPTPRAGEIGIDESKAQEITAYLCPNPDVSVFVDQIDIFSGNPYRPLGSAFPSVAGSYLHERQHNRELRGDSAQEGNTIAVSQQAGLERNLAFNLSTAFVNTLQAKAVWALAKESLEYYDKVLAVSRDRFQTGDIARVDLSRLELQHVQFESDVETPLVSLRTAKIGGCPAWSALDSDPAKCRSAFLPGSISSFLFTL
jgi:cobalt-zinc-cadmium efflux system outer membrane protein